MILSGQWCNISASLPLSLLLQQFDKSLTVLRWWIIHISLLLFQFHCAVLCIRSVHLICGFLLFPPLSQSLPIVFGFLELDARMLGCLQPASPSAFFPPPSFTCSFHTDSHLPPLFHLLLSRWMTWLPYPPPCSFTSWFKNKHGGGLAVALCSVL